MYDIIKAVSASFILALFSIGAHAHNNVLVIPMAGDTVYIDKYGIGSEGPGGGIVFHLFDEEGQHGLKAAPADLDGL